MTDCGRSRLHLLDLLQGTHIKGQERRFSLYLFGLERLQLLLDELLCIEHRFTLVVVLLALSLKLKAVRCSRERVF